MREQGREALTDFARSQTKAIADLGSLIRQAAGKREADPVLIEYREQAGDEG